VVGTWDDIERGKPKKSFSITVEASADLTPWYHRCAKLEGTPKRMSSLLKLMRELERGQINLTILRLGGK